MDQSDPVDRLLEVMVKRGMLPLLVMDMDHVAMLTEIARESGLYDVSGRGSLGDTPGPDKAAAFAASVIIAGTLDTMKGDPEYRQRIITKMKVIADMVKHPDRN